MCVSLLSNAHTRFKSAAAKTFKSPESPAISVSKTKQITGRSLTWHTGCCSVLCWCCSVSIWYQMSWTWCAGMCHSLISPQQRICLVWWWHNVVYKECDKRPLSFFSRADITAELETATHIWLTSCVFLPNQACWSPWTSIARPKSASFTAAPFILLANNRFSGWDRHTHTYGEAECKTRDQRPWETASDSRSLLSSFSEIFMFAAFDAAPVGVG